MLKAGSLYYAIMVCVLVGICCSTLLLMSHYSNLFAINMETRTELLQNNRSAMNYYLAKVESLKNGPQELDLFENGIVSNGSVSQWGLYPILHVKTAFKKDTLSKSAIIGQKLSQKPALYLVDNDKPLQMVGKAKIIGDAQLPKKGIKRGYITTQSFSSFTFMEGTKLRSTNKLPILKETFFLPEQRNDTLHFLNDFEKGKVIYREFEEEPLHVQLTENVINNCELVGNIVLHSQDSIFIKKNNRFEDIIVDAPVIVFEKGFEGTVQAIASQKIILQEDVILGYPSSVYLKGKALEDTKISLAEKSQVLGKIVMTGVLGNNAGSNLVQIDKNAQVVGEVYCEGSTVFNGSIAGSLYTDNFYLKTKASSYENYIEDGIIDNKTLPDIFLGSIIKENDNKAYGIIKTL
ncbi:hypothetical protein [Flagellimonas sp. CMM7]|uniref:hypothetical protein n=1 Tax=Flagellimonas sp. CMM7 TaxID=2654676 RepID=UPI0013D435BA|nr:hypothetical protein [Flagellimonas sp. CMM7]UII80120.1 hypothetical protein LV704_01035 [Flagellimonas sp. CMM7]